MVYIILDRSIYTRCETDTGTNNLTKIGKEKYAAVVKWWDENEAHFHNSPFFYVIKSSLVLTLRMGWYYTALLESVKSILAE